MYSTNVVSALGVQLGFSIDLEADNNIFICYKLLEVLCP